MTQVLLPVPEQEWREPSQAQPKDQFGNPNRTQFRLTARLNDGYVRWRGWFDSRDDADAFLYALALNITEGTPVPIELWRLPTPWWHPDIGPFVIYDFATVVALTSPTGSLQTFNRPSDYTNGNNHIDTIGSGGSGGVAQSNGNRPVATGGGGGAWNTTVNLTLGATSSYQIAAAPAKTSINVATDVSGAAGASSWFNGASLGASSVGSVGGQGGQAAINNNSLSGGAGGIGASGVGSASNNGGRGGNLAAGGGSSGTGGGGAAGSSGAGNNGVDTSSVSATNGGSGDAGSGGSGGTGVVNIPSGATGGSGGNGTEYGSVGSGGGGGGALSNTNSAGGNGGNYGGGGAGAVTAAGGGPTTVNGGGAQGLIVVIYQPFKKGGFLAMF